MSFFVPAPGMNDVLLTWFKRKLGASKIYLGGDGLNSRLAAWRPRRKNGFGVDICANDTRDDVLARLVAGLDAIDVNEGFARVSQP